MMRRQCRRKDEELVSSTEKEDTGRPLPDTPGTWPAAERLLVAVSGSPYGERLIHAAKRLADELKAPWHTVYIETPKTSRQVRENRTRVWRDLRLAESL